MCSPSAPKAPPPTPKQDPRVLLSRRQFDDLMISGNPQAGMASTDGPSGGGSGNTGLTGLGIMSNPVQSGSARLSAAGLRIVR